MNNKILVILLSFALGYTANANNENEQGTGAIGYDRVQLREQIARAWPNVQPKLTLSQNITSDTTNKGVTESNSKSNQGKYIMIRFTPAFFDTPESKTNTFTPLVEMEGIIALHTEFAQDIEVGLGLKTGALRFEGGLKWTRFHTGHHITTDLDYSDDFFEMLEIFGVVFGNPYAFAESIGARETIDNLGGFVGAAYDIKLADEELLYAGVKVGLLRASLGDVFNGTHDLTSLYQVDIGIIKEVTPKMDIHLGFTHSIFNEANFELHDGNVSLGPVTRNAVSLSFLFSVGE